MSIRTKNFDRLENNQNPFQSNKKIHKSRQIPVSLRSPSNNYYRNRSRSFDRQVSSIYRKNKPNNHLKLPNYYPDHNNHAFNRYHSPVCHNKILGPFSTNYEQNIYGHNYNRIVNLPPIFSPNLNNYHENRHHAIDNQRYKHKVISGSKFDFYLKKSSLTKDLSISTAANNKSNFNFKKSPVQFRKKSLTPKFVNNKNRNEDMLKLKQRTKSDDQAFRHLYEFIQSSTESDSTTCKENKIISENKIVKDTSNKEKPNATNDYFQNLAVKNLQKRALVKKLSKSLADLHNINESSFESQIYGNQTDFESDDPSQFSVSTKNHNKKEKLKRILPTWNLRTKSTSFHSLKQFNNTTKTKETRLTESNIKTTTNQNFTSSQQTLIKEIDELTISANNNLNNCTSIPGKSLKKMCLMGKNLNPLSVRCLGKNAEVSGVSGLFGRKSPSNKYVLNNFSCDN